MANFQAKNPLQSDRQLKVQRLSIPFVIVGSATSSSVSVTNDEPGFLYIRTQGKDGITPNLESGETATYTGTATDSTGVFNIMVRIQEPINKVVSCRVADRLRGTSSLVYIDQGESDEGLASNGSDIMLTCDSDVALNTGNTLDACLELEYVVED